MRRTIAFLFVASWCARESCAYDYASACARPYRSSRARAPAAPCDLSKTNYCTTPGQGYPWHAIRRFVRENQGLMKRMYGEERHIAVLKAELENFIEDEDEADDMKNSDFSEDIIKTKLMYTKKNHGGSRAMKVKPHFRPIQTTSPSLVKNKYDNDTLKVKPLATPRNESKADNSSNNNTTEVPNNEILNEDKGISYKTRLESIANVEINNLDPDVITLEAVIKQSIETNSIYSSFTTTTAKSEPLTPDPKNDTNAEKDVLTTTENIIANSTATETETTDDITVTDEDFTTTEATKEEGWKAIITDTSTLPPTLLFSEHDKFKNDRVDTSVNDKKEEFHPKPQHHQESVRPAVIKLRGANACESKEEMAAPFWANSTRGEVLALLNMYPFEQYIHLETCVHEKKQMYCREGCRCEQQYRLHRLLAYDPRNECRGIFADWFKFPACCVCKCYDVPLEFRARSPRILHPQYDDEVKRAIYEDVARDWYAMNYDEEDLY